MTRALIHEQPDRMLHMDISHHPLARATIADVGNYPFPDGADPTRFADVRERALALRRDTPYALSSGICGVTYEICWYMRGLQQWFMDVIDQPQFCEALIDGIRAQASDLRAPARNRGPDFGVLSVEAHPLGGKCWTGGGRWPMQKSKGVRLVALALLMSMLGTLVAGCAQEEAQAQVARSEAERADASNVVPSDVATLVAGNSAFAFDLYQALADEGGNLFFSPFSISAALAMTYAGARGETERQMADTLHFTLPQERLHPAFNALDLALVGREQGEDFRLRVANAIWGQAGHSFLQAFLDALAVNYGAGLRLLDFAADPEAARQTINDWVSEQTEAHIKDLIPQGGVDPATRLVLANAIYFLGKWAHPFDAARTRDGVFHTLDGREVPVPLMRMPEPEALPYLGGDGYQAVELPYRGEEMSMLVLVPDEGRFEAFQAGLDAPFLETVVEGLLPRQVFLTLPKFRYESEFSLAERLAALGMPDAFGAADFSGMDGTRNLFISAVFHKAFVAVDEAGTEAAAATAVVVGESLPLVDVTLTVDRPFVFLIRDRETGSILFLGRVVDPS